MKHHFLLVVAVILSCASGNTVGNLMGTVEMSEVQDQRSSEAQEMFFETLRSFSDNVQGDPLAM